MKILKKLNLGKKHLRGKNKILYKNFRGNKIMIICVSYLVKQFFAWNINSEQAFSTYDLMTSHLHYDYVAQFRNYMGIELNHTFLVNQKIL